MSTLGERLRAPFEPHELKWKPQAVSKDQTKAMAIAFIDARAVMDRLDEVCGVGGWSTSHTRLANDQCECTLSIWVGDRWVSQSDVGSESDQQDEGDKTKSAYSDGLKRAAVRFGIGRYLYRFPAQWVDYDAMRKRFVSAPKIPDWALPKSPEKERATDGKPNPMGPKTGAELMVRLATAERLLVERNACVPGELSRLIAAEAKRSSMADRPEEWKPEEVAVAYGFLRKKIDEMNAKIGGKT